MSASDTKCETSIDEIFESHDLEMFSAIHPKLSEIIKSALYEAYAIGYNDCADKIQKRCQEIIERVENS